MRLTNASMPSPGRGRAESVISSPGAIPTRISGDTTAIFSVRGSGASTRPAAAAGGPGIDSVHAAAIDSSRLGLGRRGLIRKVDSDLERPGGREDGLLAEAGTQ